MNRRDAIEELQQELQRLTLASTNIRRAIESLERNPNLDVPPIVDNQPATRRIDANGDRSACEASESTPSPTIDYSWEVKRTRGERFLGRRGQRR